MFRITGGRHPVVEAALKREGRPFVAALITLDPETERPADPQAELQGYAIGRPAPIDQLYALTGAGEPVGLRAVS